MQKWSISRDRNGTRYARFPPPPPSLFGFIYQPTNVTNSVTFTYNATRRQGNYIRFIIDVAATGSPALKCSDNLRWNDDLKRQCVSIATGAIVLLRRIYLVGIVRSKLSSLSDIEFSTILYRLSLLSFYKGNSKSFTRDKLIDFDIGLETSTPCLTITNILFHAILPSLCSVTLEWNLFYGWIL